MRKQEKQECYSIIRKTTNNRCWQRRGKQETHLHCWWECKLISHYENSMSVPQKLKIQLPYDSPMPLLGISPMKTETLIQKDMYSHMFIATLFIVAKIWTQHKCPSRDEWIKNMWHICTMEYYSSIEKNELSHLQQHGWI